MTVSALQVFLLRLGKETIIRKAPYIILYRKMTVEGLDSMKVTTLWVVSDKESLSFHIAPKEKSAYSRLPQPS